jgi:hypothetical protein
MYDAFDGFLSRETWHTRESSPFERSRSLCKRCLGGKRLPSCDRSVASQRQPGADYEHQRQAC